MSAAKDTDNTSKSEPGIDSSSEESSAGGSNNTNTSELGVDSSTEKSLPGAPNNTNTLKLGVELITEESLVGTPNTNTSDLGVNSTSLPGAPNNTNTSEPGADLSTKESSAEGLTGCRRLWKDNKTVIMSSFVTGTVTYALGVLTTYILINIHTPLTGNQTTVDLLSTEDTLHPALDAYFQQDNVQKILRQRLLTHATNAPSKIVDTTTTVTHNVFNVTNDTELKRMECQCLLESEQQWRQFEADLKASEKKLQEQYEAKLQVELKNLNKTFGAAINNTAKEIKNDMTKMKTEVNDDFNEKLTTTRTDLETTVSKATDTLNGEQKKMDERIQLQPEVMEMTGFMTIGMFGPVLVVLGLVELLTVLVVCCLFSRTSSKGSSHTETRPSSAPPLSNGGLPRPIKTDNHTLACLSFREADEDRVIVWGRQLIQGLAGVTLRSIVISSIQDVSGIPDCRAALVFVDPDEREMIIEDKRYHIGRGLRRNAVQRLLDSGVEVFIIIFDDKNSRTLTEQHVYNRRLGQVRDHAQLNTLRAKNRVFSIFHVFLDHQSNIIMGELGQIFH